QRAGRSNHRPNERSRICFILAHAFEIIEIEAFARAIDKGLFETYSAPVCPLDVIAQFLCIRASASGFEYDQARTEIRSAYSFQRMTDTDYNALMRFLTTGGEALAAYPDYRKLEQQRDGRYRCSHERIRRLIKLNIGTITADPSITVQFASG